jgi:hypothetical protein
VLAAVATIAAVACTASISASGAVIGPRSNCPSVFVLASRGSGDLLGKDDGLSGPGGAFAKRLGELVAGVQPWANPYNAVGVFSWNLKKLAPQLINGLGAATKLSGLGLGAYHDSVVGGEQKLAAEIEAVESDCRTTQVVLVGYSQGAQVAADVYQRSLNDRARKMVAAVVLFGDPYFNGGDRAVDRGSFSGRRDGFLGKRPAFTSGGALVLSYCHSHDPICQGALYRVGPTRTLDVGALTFRQHLNYTSFGEPKQAAKLVADRLRRAPPTSTTPPPRASGWPTTRNDGPPALYLWLGASFISPAWASCDRDTVYCLVGDNADQRVLVFKLSSGVKELGWISENSDPTTALQKAGFDATEISALLAPKR